MSAPSTAGKNMCGWYIYLVLSSFGVPQVLWKVEVGLEHIGDRIGKLMRIHGLNQKELAAAVGATTASMSRYLKNGREPKIDVVAKLARVLHTTTDYLICGDVQGGDFDEVYRMVAGSVKKMSDRERLVLVGVLSENLSSIYRKDVRFADEDRN